MVTSSYSACVIIPARYNSSRFPGKPLIKINGKPMILHVAEKAAMAVGVDNVFIATDDRRISEVVFDAGYNFIMTDSKLLTGTDRVAKACQELDYNIIVNLQGDEPMVDPEDIKKIITEKLKNPGMIVNGYSEISDDEYEDNINIPKVLFNENSTLVYISRNVIPGVKDVSDRPKIFYKQVCIYAYSKEELLKFYSFGRKSTIEKYEDIEILRFFDLGINVKMIYCSGGSLAVDAPADVQIVERALKEKSSVKEI